MIRHIVLFKLNDSIADSEKKILLAKIKYRFEELITEIDAIQLIEVRFNINPNEEYDIHLLVLLECMEDLEYYANHPEHLKVVNELIKPNVQKRACVDVCSRA